MGNSHSSKFYINTFFGLVFITAGVTSIVYASFNKPHKMDWVFWSIVAVIAINTGLIFLGSGVVHKVKADLIRRQKQKSKSDRMGIE